MASEPLNLFTGAPEPPKAKKPKAYLSKEEVAGLSLGICSKCEAPMGWGVLFGKAHPFNSDGTSHFDTCPFANEFRSKKR